MKYVVLLIFVSIFTYACSGDCLQCHPVLKKSIESKHHVILKRCIECHTSPAVGMSECGGDCFSCHSQNKLIKTSLKEHQNLASCKECHANKEDLLNFQEQMNSQPSLLDLMENK